MASRAATRRPWPRRAPSLSRAERRFAGAPISRRRCCQWAINRALAQVAQRNAAVVRARFPGRPAIEVVEGDAAAFRLPPGPLVVFLNHPFWGPVMRRVAASLLNPALPEAFDARRRSSAFPPTRGRDAPLAHARAAPRAAPAPAP